MEKLHEEIQQLRNEVNHMKTIYGDLRLALEMQKEKRNQDALKLTVEQQEEELCSVSISPKHLIDKYEKNEEKQKHWWKIKSKKLGVSRGYSKYVRWEVCSKCGVVKNDSATETY